MFLYRPVVVSVVDFMDKKAQKVMNRIVQNWNSIDSADETVEGKVMFANWSLDKLRKVCRDSKQKIMLELILAGMESHPLYGKYMDALRKEFKTLRPASNV